MPIAPIIKHRPQNLMPLCHLGQRHTIAMAFFNDPYSSHRMTKVRNLPGVRRQGFWNQRQLKLSESSGSSGWLYYAACLRYCKRRA